MHIDARPRTVDASQSLLMMNSPLVLESSEHLAKRVMAAEANDSARVQALWSVVYSRAARADEVADALAHVHAVSQMRGEASFAWQNLAQALLASNEFMHVE